MSVNKKIGNLVRLGDYIELCDERNIDGKYTLNDVRGISIEKKFIDTKANMDDVPLDKYKIVKDGMFAFNVNTARMGEKFAIALCKDETYLVSSIYNVFEVIDKSILLPEYLYIIFNREEFDRYVRFNSWGSARETFDWSVLCDTQIPLPDIDTQQKLVDVYNGLKALAEQNEALTKPLTEACQAYIVDCKKKYPEVKLGGYIREFNEQNYKGNFALEDVRGVSIQKKFIDTKANMDDVPLDKYKIVKDGMFAFNVNTARMGEKFAIALCKDETYLVSSIYDVFEVIDKSILLPEYLYIIFNREEFDRYVRFNSWGSARETFTYAELCEVSIPMPPIEIQQAIVDVYNCAEVAKKIAAEARELMKTLCPALVQRALKG
ncbi:MAG: restriction endonuclease subunit S [Bacteroidota bacterium]